MSPITSIVVFSLFYIFPKSLFYCFFHFIYKKQCSVLIFVPQLVRKDTYTITEHCSQVDNTFSITYLCGDYKWITFTIKFVCCYLSPLLKITPHAQLPPLLLLVLVVIHLTRAGVAQGAGVDF